MITRRQREYYRYTGSSAELERRGAGSSRSELAWVERQNRKEGERVITDREEADSRKS